MSNLPLSVIFLDAIEIDWWHLGVREISIAKAIVVNWVSCSSVVAPVNLV